MKNAVIAATGLFTPPHSISNDELVSSFNTYVENFNRANAEAIAAGAVEALGRRLKVSAKSERSRLERTRFHLTGPMATINLTVHETDLLVAFLIAQERTLERWLVAEKFGLSGDDINTASMEVRLSKLRKKMQLAGLDAPFIRSLRNTGYMLCHEIELI